MAKNKGNIDIEIDNKYLFTQKEIADILNVSASTVYKWEIPKYKKKYHIKSVINYMLDKREREVSNRFEDQIKEYEDVDSDEFIKRKRSAEALKKEFEVLQMYDLLVDKRESEDKFNNILLDIKNTFLNTEQVASKIYGLSEYEINEHLKDYIVNSIEKIKSIYEMNESEGEDD